jgi:hypothetical protein
VDTVLWENPTITIGVVLWLWREFTVFGNVAPLMWPGGGAKWWGLLAGCKSTQIPLVGG